MDTCAATRRNPFWWSHHPVRQVLLLTHANKIDPDGTFVCQRSCEYLHILEQCFSKCGPWPFAKWSAGGFGRKSIANVSDAERMKDMRIHAFVTFVTLTTGIIFLYLLACNSGCGEFYERLMVHVCTNCLWSGLHVHWLPMKWSTIAKSLRNTGLED
jgi:hypothetical protein